MSSAVVSAYSMSNSIDMYDISVPSMLTHCNEYGLSGMALRLLCWLAAAGAAVAGAAGNVWRALFLTLPTLRMSGREKSLIYLGVAAASPLLMLLCLRCILYSNT